MSSDAERLKHILEAISQIQKYSVKGRDAFANDELIQNWIVRHLQIIGEAASKVSTEFKNSNKTIPWKEIVGMRHILVHDYFAIDVERVWEVVASDLDRLQNEISKLVK